MAVFSHILSLTSYTCVRTEGLLAGLYEFPTLPVTATDGPSLDAASSRLLTTYLAGSSGSTTPEQSPSTVQHSVECGSILHIFSHIRMTYHVRNTTLVASPERPDLRQPGDDELLGILREVTEDGGADKVDQSERERPAKKRKKERAKSKPSKRPHFKNPDSPRVRWVRASEVENEKCVALLSSVGVAEFCHVSGVIQH